MGYYIATLKNKSSYDDASFTIEAFKRKDGSIYQINYTNKLCDTYEGRYDVKDFVKLAQQNINNFSKDYLGIEIPKIEMKVREAPHYRVDKITLKSKKYRKIRVIGGGEVKCDSQGSCLYT